MKKLFILIISFISFNCFSQEIYIDEVTKIYLSDNKTTYLDFPADIILVDIGNDDYAPVVKDEGDILYIKAKSNQSKPTNLFVKYGTKLFICEIVYKKNPDILLYDFKQKVESSILFEDSIQKEIESIELIKTEKNLSVLEQERIQGVRLIKNAVRNIQTVGVPKSGIIFSLARVSASSNFIYYKLIINNISNIDFEVDFYSIYSEEKPNNLFGAKNKKISNIDVFATDGPNLIKSKENGEIILTTKKYSINQRGVLVIQLYEKNGSRHITLNIPSNYILNF